MKTKVLFTVALLTALLCPQKAEAYLFNSVSPSGHTLHYDTIGGSAAVVGFYNGTLTGDLIIPDSVTYNGVTYAVTEIYENAFRNNPGMTSVSIPNTVRWIGGMAFKNCTGLTSITIPESVTRIGFIPSRQVFDCTFQGCTGLTEVIFNADSCISMRNPFLDCDNSITTLVIGNNVKAIPETAFRDCGGITSLYIPASVSHIGFMAFEGCGEVASIVVDANNPVFDSRNNCNAIIETATNTLVRGCHNTVIPAEVRTIGKAAYAGCTHITSFAIPPTIDTLEVGAFRGCTAMTSVDIPSSVKWIDNAAFYHCESLASVTVPSSVDFLGTNAFAHCLSLTTAVIPSSVTSLRGYTFFGCENLTSVSLPATLTRMSSCEFKNCSNLTSVDIPEGVDYMGEYLFFGCSRLSSVTLPRGLHYLGDYAFFACSGLTYIRSLAPEVPETPDTSYMFLFVPDDIPVYVPCGSSVAYDSAWGHFTNFVEELSFTYDIQSADSAQGIVEIQTIPTSCEDNTLTFSASAADGYAFSHWSDGNTENPRSLQLTQDTALTANFSSTIAVDEADGQRSDINVRAVDGRIVVEGAEGETVCVYDIMGRPVSDQVQPAGVYIVKVGDRSARKVVVIR